MDTRNSVQERISRCVRLRRNVPPGKRSFKTFTPIAVRIRPPAPGGLPECRRLASRALKCVRGLDSRAVEEESHGAGGLSLAFAEGTHQLLELCGTLDLEEDFVVVVGNLDVQVLRVGGRLLAGGAVLVLVRHCYSFAEVALRSGRKCQRAVLG
ncbi:hypothetical protein HG530_012856 [Fusarium avenaceum]|nr:hypothetical protein HG530_012856 [Fusarium avenaceum]